jgi:hypothetical protein
MEEAHFIFTSDNLELKSEGENFFVEGYISTSDLDLVNDIVTKACLLDMAEQMKERNIKFDVEHESFRGKSNLERETNKTIIPVAKIDDFLMDKKGIKVRAVLNKSSHRFDEVKGSIEGGFLDAFSIAYIPVKTNENTKGPGEPRKLEKINLLNVAFTGNPVNTEAKMTNVFAKSLKFLQEQEDHIHISEGLIKLQEAKNMSGEEIKKNIDEVKDVVAETEPKAKEDPKKDEETDEEKKKRLASEKKDEELAEVKSKLEQTEKELAEVKALLNKPVLKSKVEQKDKSGNFEEKKSLNPLDLIA